MGSRSKQKDLEKVFREADKDSSGYLTQEEYVRVFREQGVNISDEAARAYFREKDKDMDGEISFDEFVGKAIGDRHRDLRGDEAAKKSPYIG